MVRQEVRWWLLRVFYLVFSLFIINRIFFVSSGMMEQAVSCLMYPFLKVHANIVGLRQHQLNQKKTVEELQKELDLMTIEQQVLRAQVAKFQAQQIFIEQTKELIEFAQRYDQDRTSIAKVLLSYSCPQEDVIFIEGGRNRGYGKDDIVVYKNALIGRIVELYPWYSKVAVVTDQRCRVSSMAGLEAEGISCGKNNSALELCFVPHYHHVEVGELVVSTGHGLMYPSGFTIGVVQSVATDLVSHTITLKPYYDISSIQYVCVLLKNQILPVQAAQEAGPE